MDIARVLQYLRPGAQFAVDDPADYASVSQWRHAQAIPSLAEAQAAWDALQAQDAADAAAKAAEATNERTLDSQLDNAITALIAYQAEISAFQALGLTPTALQVRDNAVKQAKREMAYNRALVALMRLRRRKLSSVEGAALKA